MKYLKVFETEALQNEFRNSQDYIEPHVSCLINGENVKYNKSEEFVAIAVSSGNDYVVYIKSTELSDFVSMNTGVHVYSNEACTTPADDGNYTFTDSGLAAYYASEGDESGELPGCDKLGISNGIINRYIVLDVILE